MTWRERMQARGRAWRNLADDESPNADSPCRYGPCRARPTWAVHTYPARPEPGAVYTDVVCGRHLLAYLDDFGIAGHFGRTARLVVIDPRSPTFWTDGLAG